MLRCRLADFRELHGLTQEELASRSGVSRQVIARLEAEPGFLASMSTALRLCLYFHVDIGRLFWIDWSSATVPVAEQSEPLQEVPA